ncbi:MAG: 1-acyl-sn-glycerol-3-phosphate acyltransferase [Bacteroidales bacterium]|nr:1-acyl-sn-glycerol-3-phosphate acyltransferase [Bacteroidales bacterium]
MEEEYLSDITKERGIVSKVFGKISRAYVGLVHDLIYYRGVYMVGRENIPPVGTPMIIVSNHQNTLNDALAVEFGFKDRDVCIFTRADMFKKAPIRWMLRSFNLLPAFRYSQDGLDTVSFNEKLFKIAGKDILKGNAALIFPEAVNQDKRWLGNFSEGYLRMAFDTVQDDKFQTDIKILPIVNHYSDYFAFREDVMLKIGEPISLKDYYELYQTKPRTARRNINAEVRSRIEQMMLNITDLDNYDAIDYLRLTYGRRYCRLCGGNPARLPDRLESDKALFAELEQARDQHADDLKEIYEGALKLKDACKRCKVEDKNFDEKRPSTFKFIMQFLGLVVLFPLFIFSLIPNLLLFLAPMPFTDRLKAGTSHQAMFVGGVRFALNTLFVGPLVYTLQMIIDVYFFGWIAAAVHLVLLPFFGIGAWQYRRGFITLKRQWRFRRERNRGLAGMDELRTKIFDKLDNILSKNTWKKEL